MAKRRVTLKELDKLNGKIGKPRLFNDPLELWELYKNYRQWILDNPIEVVDYVGKDAKEIIRKHFEPPTWQGFEAYLFEEESIAINASQPISLDKYRYNFENNYSDYVGIIRAIASAMFQRKFAGASVGVYQHQIIAKEIGLIEKQEVKTFQAPILEGGKELPED